MSQKYVVIDAILKRRSHTGKKSTAIFDLCFSVLFKRFHNWARNYFSIFLVSNLSQASTIFKKSHFGGISSMSLKLWACLGAGDFWHSCGQPRIWITNSSKLYELLHFTIRQKEKELQLLESKSKQFRIFRTSNFEQTVKLAPSHARDQDEKKNRLHRCFSFRSSSSVYSLPRWKNTNQTNQDWRPGLLVWPKFQWFLVP